MLLICCVLGMAAPVWAAETVGWLYDVRVPVADQSVEARKTAAGEGLKAVLTRISGRTRLGGNEVIARAAASPQEYYNRFSYSSDWVDGARQSFLELSFSAAAVQRLARTAQLPIWSSRRPLVVTWIATERDGDFVLATGEEDALYASALEQAQVRGLPIEATEPLPPAHLVWNGSPEAVVMHAEGLGARALLLGRVRQGDDVARGNFTFRLLGDGDGTAEAQEFTFRGQDEASVMAQAMNQVADTLSRRYSVAGGEAGFLNLNISGVRTVQDYAALMRYLQRLEYLTSVSVLAVDGDAVELVVETPADAGRLAELFEADRRIVPDDSANVLAVPFLWRG